MSKRADFNGAVGEFEGWVKTPSPSGVTPRPFGPRGVYLGKMRRANRFQILLFTRYGDRFAKRSTQRVRDPLGCGARPHPTSG